MIKTLAFHFNSFFRFVFFVFVLGLSVMAQAQEYQGYDELSVEMSVPDYGVVEVPIAIKGETAYISISELFDTFQLKSDFDRESGNVSGYMLSPEAKFSIDISNKTITYRELSYKIKEDDYILTPTGLYLRSGLFAEVFGLRTDFNFRKLAIDFDTDFELPVILKQKRARVRENLNKIQGEFKADTLIERRYPFLKGGMFDWGINTTQQTNGFDENRFNLGFGGMLAGGETNIQLNYSDRLPFTSRNQFYQWRYVNNQSNVFKQVTAGKIFTGATSSLFAPVLGVQLSNSPLTNRRSYGTYVLNDYTEPRWTVELYVNNVLVDYTQADASGFYSFDVPLMYGNTNVSLRFYGPYGEEMTEDRVINIPYTFVPENKLEYRLSAGIVEDDRNRQFSRLDLNYGLGNALTIGGGVEFLSEVSSGEIMPFINTSIRLASGLLFSGEYNYGVKGEGLLSYRTPSNMQFDLNYIKYHEDQTAINYNYLEERKFSFSAPIRNELFSVYTRFNVNQIILPTTEFTTAQLLFSGNLLGISTNLSTFAIYNDRLEEPTIYSTLGQTYRLPYQIFFSPQLQYDFSDSELRNLNLEFEKVIFQKGFVNLSVENNFLQDIFTFELGLRYAFDFAQASLTSRLGNRNSSFIQSARGSMRLDDNTGDVMFSNRTAVARGGITLIPFLDFDNDGKKGELEPGVPGLELESNPGIIDYNKDQSILRISNLQPYQNLNLKIDQTSLDNIAWEIINPNIEVESVPNYYKPVYIPVKVLGEVSGFVSLMDNRNTRGIGRIIVNIKDQNDNLVKSILTEGDGYFYYLGLTPGNYIAEIDKEQLDDLDFSTSGSLDFEIEVSEYGDIVDDLEFTLSRNSEE